MRLEGCPEFNLFAEVRRKCDKPAASPRRQIDRGDAPTALVAWQMAPSGPGEPVDPGQRAVFDRKGERSLRFDVERDRERRTNRAAVGNANDVPALLRLTVELQCALDASREVGEAFSLRWPLGRRCQPKAMPLGMTLCPQLCVPLALPAAEMLLGEVLFHQVVGQALRQALAQGIGGLAGSLQIRHHPDGLARQARRQLIEQRRVFAVGRQIVLAVDHAAAVDRSMTDEPPAGFAHKGLVSNRRVGGWREPQRVRGDKAA